MSKDGLSTPGPGARSPEPARPCSDPPQQGALATMARTCVRATLGEPLDGPGAVRACATLAARTTALVAGAYERVSQEEPIACRSGCSFCCHLRVMVYPHEAIALADHIRSNLPAPAAERLTQRLAAHAARLEALDPQEPVPAMPCAFLVEGRCSVYALRPLSCAGFHSLQRGACEKRYETRGGRVGIPVSRHLQEQAVSVQEEVGHAVAELGFPARRVELATAVLALLRRPQGMDRWRAGLEWPRDARGLVKSA